MSGHSITQPDAFDAFAQYQQARNLSPTTIERRRSSLAGFARFMHPATIFDAETADIEEWICTLRTASTKASYRSDLSAFYTWAVRRKVCDTNPVADMDPIKVPRGMPRPLPINAVPGIVRAATDPLRIGLALAAYAGLRRAEVVAVTSEDVQFVPEPLLVVRHGKGGKDRIVPLHPTLAAMLRERRPQGRFVPWTPARFGRAAATHLRRLGYDATVHQARHSFGSEAARALEGNMVALARLLGHANTSTSQIYNGWAGGETATRLARLYVVA